LIFIDKRLVLKDRQKWCRIYTIFKTLRLKKASKASLICVKSFSAPNAIILLGKNSHSQISTFTNLLKIREVFIQDFLGIKFWQSENS
jgi:hypothetical protein